MAESVAVERPRSSQGNLELLTSLNEGVQRDGPETEQDEEDEDDEENLEKTRRLLFWKKIERGEKSDWWFASTGIPLLAATLGPLANMTSIVALVTYWRMDIYIDGEFVSELEGRTFSDPKWCYYFNVASLICGFLGNIFLLFNFTQRIRYIIALPATIIFWYLATGFLIGITTSMQIYAPPNRPFQTYTQGFWYAVVAAAIYLVCSMLLMVNMLGYFLGHYSDSFCLTNSQRTLILQTMLFFIWLGGGAAVFMVLENKAGQGWQYADSLYFCDVTVLTVGFGDLYPTTDLGRGIVFPFSVGGIVTLALIVSSIYKFMRELGEENIVMKHADRMRQRTAERTVTNSFDLREREHEQRFVRRRSKAADGRPKISAPMQPRMMRTAMGNTVRRAATTTFAPLPSALKPNRKPRLLLLREEEDRFHAMRKIQRKSKKYKQWLALLFSACAFGVLWCIGAVVFWQAEKGAQGMTYFRALYFCYISLLTIGYGDLAPKTSAGRTFFVVWSLIAVPTMTILISNLGDTVVDKFRRSSDKLADFTVLPKHGIWRAFLENHPRLLGFADGWNRRKAVKAARRRVEKGFRLEDPEKVGEEGRERREGEEGVKEAQGVGEDVEADVKDELTDREAFGHQLALSIQRVAADINLPKPKRYAFDEWVEFARLIRLTSNGAAEEDEDSLIEWQWLGSDSPLISGLSESEWLLQRLCESLVRLAKRPAGEAKVNGRSRDEDGGGVVEKHDSHRREGASRDGVGGGDGGEGDT